MVSQTWGENTTKPVPCKLGYQTQEVKLGKLLPLKLQLPSWSAAGGYDRFFGRERALGTKLGSRK
jgi:hypothetical protein